MNVISNSVTVIRPPKGWFHLDLKELWAFRELAYFFVWRDIKVRYKQTAIGALWAIFQPFMAMVVFSVFFGRFVGIPSDGIPYPIFVYAGLLFWDYFSFGLSHSASSMVENGNIIKKIYFPRLIIPIASSLTGLVDFFFATLVLIGLMAYYHYLPYLAIIFYVPLLLGIAFLSSMGIGCFLASINVKYRDVRYALPFFIQMLMFVTPVIYPVSIVGEKYRWLLALNPMSSVIETARAVLFGKPIDGHLIFISFGMALIFFLLGIIYFRKTERFFADII
ncbi:MAG: ABC transporter permease [bacterium]|nr:ABC transporter permease [bacterium]